VIISKHVEVVPPVKKLLNKFYKNLRKTTVWRIITKWPEINGKIAISESYIQTYPQKQWTAFNLNSTYNHCSESRIKTSGVVQLQWEPVN